MTILAFWPVGCPGDGQPERHEFEIGSHEETFKKMWKNRDKWGMKFYDIETDKEENPYGIQGLLDGYDFEADYNDEELDGGHWVFVLHLRSDFVRDVTEGENSSNLEMAFDIEVANLHSEEERRRRVKLQMDQDQKGWCEMAVEKLKFLREHGFKVVPHYVWHDDWPDNFVEVSIVGCSVTLQGSDENSESFSTSSLHGPFSLKGEDTFESFIKKIASWTK